MCCLCKSIESWIHWKMCPKWRGDRNRAKSERRVCISCSDLILVLRDLQTQTSPKDIVEVLRDLLSLHGLYTGHVAVSMSTNSGTSFFLIRVGEAESIQHDPLFCSVCKTTPAKPLEESLQPGVCLSVWLVPQVLCNLGRAPAHFDMLCKVLQMGALTTCL